VWGLLASMAVVAAACGGCGTEDVPGAPDLRITAPPAEGPAPLSGVRSWAYQIQGLEENGAVTALVDSPYDLVVIEPTRTIIESEGFDTAGLVRALHERGKLVLAYIDIGEAEDYRTYWAGEWEAPTEDEPGAPDFLVTVDPDGWSGNYPVAYWDERWKDIVIYGGGSMLSQVLADGFDGVYLDWIEAYAEEHVAAAAKEADVDPAEEMVTFVREIAEYGRAGRPGFLVLPQNGAELARERPEYLRVIDGLAQEGLTLRGEADTEWSDPDSGDIPVPHEDREYLHELFELYKGADLPIFCADYALEPDKVALAYANAAEAGCLGYVSQTPLSRLTDTPFP